MYQLIISTHIGKYWRATSFGAISGSILNLIALQKKSRAQNTAGSFHALATATVKTYAIHGNSFRLASVSWLQSKRVLYTLAR
jgi:hypothetical protein